MTAGTRSITSTIDAYFAFLNEVDGAELRQLAEQAWAPDARYIDPHHDGQGRETLVGMVEAVHGQYPGYVFRRSSGIDAHHDEARYDWEFCGPDGTVVLSGVDVVTFDASGRLQRVVGFHGGPPAL